MAAVTISQMRREVSERAILDAALELFTDAGFEQTSIRKIAARVGYSPTSIYRYFKSKDDIFLALAEEGLRALSSGDPANEPSDDPLQDVRAAMWRIYTFSKERPNFFALIFVERHVPMISRSYGRFTFMTEVWKNLEARIRRCIDAGIFPEKLHPFVALRLLSAPVFGIAAQRISGRFEASENVDALVHDSIEVTIAGLCAGAHSRARAPEKHRYS